MPVMPRNHIEVPIYQNHVQALRFSAPIISQYTCFTKATKNSPGLGFRQTKLGIGFRSGLGISYVYIEVTVNKLRK